jgi:hypothetical protein
MYLSFLTSLLFIGPVFAAPTIREDDDTALNQFYDLLAEAASNQVAYLQSSSSSNCTTSNTVVRKPW